MGNNVCTHSCISLLNADNNINNITEYIVDNFGEKFIYRKGDIVCNLCNKKFIGVQYKKYNGDTINDWTPINPLECEHKCYKVINITKNGIENYDSGITQHLFNIYDDKITIMSQTGDAICDICGAKFKVERKIRNDLEKILGDIYDIDNISTEWRKI